MPFTGTNLIQDIKTATKDKVFDVVQFNNNNPALKERAKQLTPQLKDFFSKILVYDMHARINFVQIYEHSWLASTLKPE